MSGLNFIFRAHCVLFACKSSIFAAPHILFNEFNLAMSLREARRVITGVFSLFLAVVTVIAVAETSAGDTSLETLTIVF